MMRVVLALLSLLTPVSLVDVVAQTPSSAAQAYGLVLSIGSADGTPATTFDGVTSAVRLSNGHIVVADAGASQIRWFDSTGRFLRSFGRRGQGPEEFGNRPYIYLGTSDTVVAYDLSGGRYHHLNGSGTFSRTDTVGERSRLSMIYARSVSEFMPPQMALAQARRILARIPVPPGQLARRVIFDEAGRAWTPDTAAPDWWLGYDSTGALLLRFSLPPNVRPLAVQGTHVLAVATDSLGVESVQLHRVRTHYAGGGTASAAAPYDSDAELARAAELVSSMRRSLRNAVVAQEFHFAQNQRYASEVREMQVSMPQATRLDIVATTTDGYWLIVSSAQTRITCMFASGPGMPQLVGPGCG